MSIPLVLAANVETLIGVAFVVISIISGLTNYLNTRAKPNAPVNRGARPVRPRSERIQSEIEQFMREQVRRQEGDASPPASPRPQPEQRQIPPQKQPQRRPQAPRGPSPRPPARKPTESRQRQPLPQSYPQGPAAPPRDDISQRKSIASEGLGQSLRDHLKTAMTERVQAEAQAHLTSSVSAGVTRHLGTSSVFVCFTCYFCTFGTPSAVSPPLPVAEPGRLQAAELRTPEGIRRALIAQVVLERPAALRRRRSAE